MPDSLRRAIRTLLHLVAGGGLTALVDLLVKGMSPESAAIWLSIWTVVVSYVHNFLEDNTNFPALLKASASSGQNPVTRDPKVD